MLRWLRMVFVDPVTHLEDASGRYYAKVFVPISIGYRRRVPYNGGFFKWWVRVLWFEVAWAVRLRGYWVIRLFHRSYYPVGDGT